MIETPCVSICRQENGRCIGCGRSMEEISNWYSYSDKERRTVMERLEQEMRDQFQ